MKDVQKKLDFPERKNFKGKDGKEEDNRTVYF